MLTLICFGCRFTRSSVRRLREWMGSRGRTTKGIWRASPGSAGKSPPGQYVAGLNGLGKSMIAKNLLHQALLRGHTARFTAPPALSAFIAGLSSAWRAGDVRPTFSIGAKPSCLRSLQSAVQRDVVQAPMKIAAPATVTQPAAPPSLSAPVLLWCVFVGRGFFISPCDPLRVARPFGFPGCSHIARAVHEATMANP